MKIKVVELECLRCGYKWIPRKVDVRVCPNQKCHSAFWDVLKKKDGSEVKKDEKI
ncbi:hypothetical protein LCGC14_1714610 [marine sediment metagenome]|uniref:Uncharacterized protein n=1 Tax=marine sediment metagenome TaxID=412755 RepID=A0A0F9JUR7_9ZZZZ